MKSKEEKYHLYRTLRFLIKPIYCILYRPRFVNKKVIPQSGPIIVCGNHFHAFDQFQPMLATNRVLHYMAKREYFDGEHSLFGARENPKKLGITITKWLVTHARMIIRVDRDGNAEDAKSEALAVLKNGQALGLFPEGTRNNKENPAPLLLPFKFGAVSMAQKTGAWIVPFATVGEYKIFKKNHLTCYFGKPFKVSKNMDLQEANEKLYNIVADLKRQGLKDIENGKY